MPGVEFAPTSSNSRCKLGQHWRTFCPPPRRGLERQRSFDFIEGGARIEFGASEVI
jgi:hypothetical protein